MDGLSLKQNNTGTARFMMTNTMNSQLGSLEQLRRTLTHAPQTLEQIWHDQHRIWQELGWQQPQIRLWLSCLPEITISGQSSDNPTYRLGSGNADSQPKNDLGSALFSIIEQTGGRILIGQLKGKLPHGMIATDQMIQSAIKNHPELTMTGPFVSRK